MGYNIANLKNRGLLLAALAAAALIGGCGGTSSGAPLTDAGPDVQTAAAPSMAELEAVLRAELERLQVDTSREAAAAPTAGSAVFDLAAQVIEPGELGPEAGPAIRLSWTERLLGDYNQDGLVGVSDLTPLGQHYGSTVEYRDPAQCDGAACWPEGDPDGEGAANWRLARVDGNGDGQIYLTDITTIAQHWGEELCGYLVYHRAPGVEGYQLVPNPLDSQSSFTVARAQVAVCGPSAPVRYSLQIDVTKEGAHQFYVAGCAAGAGVEGPPSSMMQLDLEIIPVGDPDPPSSGDLLVIRDDGDVYDANYDALMADLEELGVDYYEVDWYAGIPEDYSPDDWDAVVWYRGGPGDADELGQLSNTSWTDSEIDDYIHLLKDGHRQLLMSQSHGRNAFVDLSGIPAPGDGWQAWYVEQYGWELLDGTIEDDDIRHPWAASLGTDKCIGLSTDWGYLEAAPRNIMATSTFGARVPACVVQYGAEAVCDVPAECFSGTGSSGDAPLEMSFGAGGRFTAVGYMYTFMHADFHPYPNAGTWFRSGLSLVPLFENGEGGQPGYEPDLAFLSYGNERAPDEDIGSHVDPNHTEGPGRLWVIGYPWAQTTITESDSGEMTRAQILQNVLAWLMIEDED